MIKLRKLFKVKNGKLERKEIADIQLGIFYLKMARRIISKKLTISQAKILIERKKGNYGLG